MQRNIITSINNKMKNYIYSLYHKLCTKKITAQTWQNLSDLLNTGIALLPAIKIISNQQQRSQKLVWQQLQQRILDGESLNQALSTLRGHSDQLVINCLHAGSNSGRLGDATALLAKYLNYKQQYKKKITKLFAYPAVVLTAAILVTIFFCHSLLPNIINIFGSSNQTLPLITTMLIKTCNMLANNASYLFIFSLLAIPTYIALSRQHAGIAKLTHALKSRFKLFRTINEYHFCSNLSLSLNNGISLLSALDCLQGAQQGLHLSVKLKNVTHNIRAGSTFYQSLRNENIYSQQMLAVIATAEETGQLNVAFKKLSFYLQQQLDHEIDNLSKLLQPLIMLLLASVVGLIVAAIYTPLFRMGQNL